MSLSETAVAASADKLYAFKIVVNVSTLVVTSVNPAFANLEASATNPTASPVERPAEIA